MIKKIDHIGIVVKSLDVAIKIYKENLGLDFIGQEENKAFNCRIGFFKCGDVLIELIEPTGDGPSKNFLDSKGEGIHHICYQEDNIKESFERAVEIGLTDYSQPKDGAGGSKVFFLKAEKLCDVETEIRD